MEEGDLKTSSLLRKTGFSSGKLNFLEVPGGNPKARVT
jgi:hypothetical protein